jgi:hypothetical protein
MVGLKKNCEKLEILTGPKLVLNVKGLKNMSFLTRPQLGYIKIGYTLDAATTDVATSVWLMW